MRKLRQRGSEIFRYTIDKGRAESKPVAALSCALEVHQSNYYPFLKAEDKADFLGALDC